MLDEGYIYLVKQSKYAAILFDCDTRGHVWPAIKMNLANCPMFLDLQYEDRGCIDPAIRILIGVARKNYSLVFVVISYFWRKGCR